MFNSKTVFIVGAGASAEASMPVGSRLTKDIAKLLRIRYSAREIIEGDDQIAWLLQQMRRQAEWQNSDLFGAGYAIADGMTLAPSIDTFLETHTRNKDFVTVGKIGIAQAIRRAEQASLLAPDRHNGSQPFAVEPLGQTWFAKLSSQMVTGVDVGEPQKSLENLSFVVFNYDRCLEVYLGRALQVYFRISSSRADKLVSEARILHPYGSLGSIFSSQSQVPFAAEEFDLKAASEGIRTYSESSEIVDQIGVYLEEAETVVFLGFAYHPANMKLLSEGLSGSRELAASKRVFATTLGLSDSDEAVVREQIRQMFHVSRAAGTDWVKMKNGTCSELFDTYWRSLTV